jgi:hypothetical protein
MGSSRLYAYLGNSLEWPRWVEAVKKGRTFVTNGPLLKLEVDGKMPGDEIRLPATGGTVQVEAGAEAVMPLEKLEVFFNGKVVETVELSGKSGRVSKRLAVKTSGWVTVRASNSKPQTPVDDSYIVGETSPVYVTVGDRPVRSREDAEYFLRWIDDLTKQAQAHPGWRSEKEKAHVFGQFEQARKLMEERARD